MFWNLIIAVLAIGPVLSGVIKNQIQHCSSSEFPCSDGSCIGLVRACDGVRDCADGFDENICLPGANSSLVLGDMFSRGKRQSSCRKDQWQCKDGGCIPFYEKCDGIFNCRDNSDETHALCRNSACQDNLFRCTYGACVDGTAPCNGEQDCVDNSDELLPRCKNESRINKGQFRCDSGQEISVTEVCDGEVNCDDGSDENIQACAGKTCDSFLFQCAYGACVDALSDCNGIQECADGSDESDELCGRTSAPAPPVATPPPNTGTGKCVLPDYPENGRYEVQGNPFHKPGQRVSGTVIVNISCDTKYKLDGEPTQIIQCNQNKPMPKCKKFCKLNPHHSVEYNCRRTVDGVLREWICGREELVGTLVVPKCRPNYYGSPLYMRCTEYDWDRIEKCPPECGTVTPSGQEYVIGGKRAKHGEIPWHAGIYAKAFRPFKQICGGSIVSTTSIISAAHCFWVDGEGKQKISEYAVAVGKIFRPWNDTHDVGAQFFNVSDIYIPSQFRGVETNFQHDIAIVKLETEIVYKPYVRPLCVNFDPQFNSRQLQAGKLGKIAGWGLTTASGRAAQVLQVVELPFVTYDQCYDESPQEFRGYITGDKICAGFRNGTALCQGDSGGGLAFPATLLSVQRYYLRGIVSTAPRNNQLCDPNQRTTFTQLISHENFVKTYIDEL